MHLPMKALIFSISAVVLLSMCVSSNSATLCVYDMSDKANTPAVFDEEIFVATLQGIVNRDRPRLFVIKNHKLDTSQMSKILKTEGPLAKAISEKPSKFDDLVRYFKRDIKGVCVWDPDIPATLNVAITAAGAENAPVVRYDKSSGSLYERFVISDSGFKFPVMVDLVGKFKEQEKIPDTDLDSTGSSKCDAYLWAKTRYLDTGKVGPTLLYNCDGYRMSLFDLLAPEDQKLFNIVVALHLDYAVAERAFAFDLSPFDDEFPIDDHFQRLGEDVRTMKAILASANKQAKGELIRVLGFPYPEIKYSNMKTGLYVAGSKHSTSELALAYGKILSSYNTYITGSSQYDNPNFSVYCKLQKPRSVVQNAGMSEDKLEENECLKSGKVTEKTFVTFIIGDFNDVTSIYVDLLPRIWQDPARGSIPISWAISPQLMDIYPNAFKELLDTRSKIDYFVAPASGAGYVNPGFLTDGKPTDVPNGLGLWSRHCKNYYESLNYTVTGNLVNGLAGPLTKKIAQAYADFSPSGICSAEGIAGFDSSKSGTDYALVGLMPVIKSLEAPQDLSDAADAIHNARPGKLPNFIAVHCRMGAPIFISNLLKQITEERPDRDYMVLDPLAFFDLLRRHLQEAQADSATPKSD